jgi:hypothetical protein
MIAGQLSLLIGCVLAAIALIALYPPRARRLSILGVLCAVISPIAFTIAFAS